jgi:hypothetical protein
VLFALVISGSVEALLRSHENIYALVYVTDNCAYVWIEVSYCRMVAVPPAFCNVFNSKYKH